MPDDDSMLGQNEVDVRNEARREYHRAVPFRFIDQGDYVPEQITLCTNDERCQADADGHDPGCPIEHQLLDEIGY